jgi:hypothetical protein
LIDQDQRPLSGTSASNDKYENQSPTAVNKRQFVEPEISQPVDVLEATTFFAALDSGPTG